MSFTRLIVGRGFAACLWVGALAGAARAENPLVRVPLTADPGARVFDGKVYVYCTHDLPDATYWNSIDWVLLSSDDLVKWDVTNPVFTLKGFSWATRWAWAPDCIAANGKYYLFLPVDRTKIGVAVGDTPSGPFHDAIEGPLIDNAQQPEAGVEPIDPALFIDDDGTPYLYFGCRAPKVVQLSKSMTALAGPIADLKLVDEHSVDCRTPAGQPPRLPQGYGEAPFLFKREGKYYFIYSNGWSPQSTQVYALANSPTGPFVYAGPVMQHADCTTQHGAIVNFHGRWLMFYQTSELSHGNPYQRNVCADELTFSADGHIRSMIPTRHGLPPSTQP